MEHRWKDIDIDMCEYKDKYFKIKSTEDLFQVFIFVNTPQYILTATRPPGSVRKRRTQLQKKNTPPTTAAATRATTPRSSPAFVLRPILSIRVLALPGSVVFYGGHTRTSDTHLTFRPECVWGKP